MSNVLENNENLKEVFKSAMTELIEERPELLREVLDDIIEDVAISRAIAEGELTPSVSRDQVFDALGLVN